MKIGATEGTDSASCAEDNGPRQGTGEAAPAINQVQDDGGWDEGASSGAEKWPHSEPAHEGSGVQ